VNPTPLLRRLDLAAILAGRSASTNAVEQAATEAKAREIVTAVRTEGEPALRRFTELFGERRPEDPLILGRDVLEEARDRLAANTRALLERAATRIRAFARAQRDALVDFELAVAGGRVGQRTLPVRRAAGYVPGGRYPLPSSALMAAIPARVAGVEEVWLAGPRPDLHTLAAAAIAGADGFLVAGGAHAIAALAYGAGSVMACDVVVGPGNVWVAAAKRLVSGDVGIDSIAGPSELVILADRNSDPELVAADLLAQAEHDVSARPILVVVDSGQTADGTLELGFVAQVERALARQLGTLPSAEVARAALRNGGAVECAHLDQAVAACDALAPEHLQLSISGAAAIAPLLRNYGALFLGERSAEVLGDYGAGPNHILPTNGTARFSSGLSVLHFLTLRTWLAIDDPPAAKSLCEDAAQFAELEGLEGHARAARLRRDGC
jgi:phosphoribosyl-ATP pyrophosphohydrolase/phosphoribosyl-AMP cyclohydrolase/histidinol dehydrogenase